MWRTRKFLDGLNCESKDENIRRRRSWARFLVRSTLGVEGRVGTPGWGLRILISKSITHTDLHKLNNKLVSAQFEHLWCTDKPRANINSQDSQDSPRPKLGGSHHLPPYIILCAWPQGQHPNVVLSQDSQMGVLKRPKLGLLQLWKPITLCEDL